MCALSVHRRLLGAPPVSRERLLPDILALSPSSLDDWERCPRLYLNRHVLRLPASDPGATARTGNLVHDLLRYLHGLGDCHDEELQTATLENHGVDENSAVRAMVAGHASRCPVAATALGHELEVVRLSRRGRVWIGTGRLDAVWVHDGVLDVRDYKTGRARDGDLADDSRARFQAWLAQPLAGDLQVRVRYEYLSDAADLDPLEYEPDAEDLARVEAELGTIVDQIRDAAGRSEFTGVREPDTCRPCGYRSICPDSAVTGQPTWPLPDDHGFS